MHVTDAIRELVRILDDHGNLELWSHTHDRNGNPCMERVDLAVADSPEQEKTRWLRGWHTDDGEQILGKIVEVG